MAGASAIARRAFADARVRTISFALLFAFAAYLQATAYREGYPTLEDRLRFARSVGENGAARLLYGEPHDLLSVGGYVSWRVGGSLAIFSAIWALLGAVRAMRADEDAGRAELVLSGVVGRRGPSSPSSRRSGPAPLCCGSRPSSHSLAGELPVGGAAYLALAIVSAVPVFVGVGAVASQLAPTKRLATALSTGVLALALALRTVAATSDGGLEWLRWATPLGWASELRPFADPQPLVLLLPLATAALLLVVAGALALRRDIGSGLLPSRDSAPPRLRLLGSPVAQALRSERAGLAAWLVGIGAFALLMGLISAAATPDVISEELQRQLEKLGTESVVTPSGWLGFSFIFFLLAVSLFCCMQLGAIRSEEAEQRLETLLALPVGRRGWLAGRLLLPAQGPRRWRSRPACSPGRAPRARAPRSRFPRWSGPASIVCRPRCSSSASVRSRSRSPRGRAQASPTGSSPSPSSGRCSARCWRRRVGCSPSPPSTTSASFRQNRSRPSGPPQCSRSPHSRASSPSGGSSAAT